MVNNIFLDRLLKSAGRETFMHSIRVQKLVCILLNYVREYTDVEKEQISFAARYHDIGKVDKEIQKIISIPRRLNKKELYVMKSHPVKGWEIVNKVTQNSKYNKAILRNIVLYHHSRPNGSGYPSCPNKKIPFYVQLITLADVFEAMTAQRVYKPAISPGEALKKMLNGKCGYFTKQAQNVLRDAFPEIKNSLIYKNHTNFDKNNKRHKL